MIYDSTATFKVLIPSGDFANSSPLVVGEERSSSDLRS